eukprot:scaffold187464_cov27-Tisochrysis_lutea.AAC.3
MDVARVEEREVVARVEEEKKGEVRVEKEGVTVGNEGVRVGKEGTMAWEERVGVATMVVMAETTVAAGMEGERKEGDGMARVRMEEGAKEVEHILGLSFP